MKLAKKTVLLTGATGGIGREIAGILASEWSDLILVARNRPNLTALAGGLPGNPLYISADLSAKSGRDKLIKKLGKTKIDILINCAGIGIYKKLSSLTDSDWYSSYELNVHTPLFLTRDLSPKLTVNIGSCSAIQYKSERSLYNSTKAALRSLSLCLNQETVGSVVHITLDSTLTDFGSLTLTVKKSLQSQGHTYLSPSWVAREIVAIIKSDSRDSEYVLSATSYENCGTWDKP